MYIQALITNTILTILVFVSIQEVLTVSVNEKSANLTASKGNTTTNDKLLETKNVLNATHVNSTSPKTVEGTITKATNEQHMSREGVIELPMYSNVSVLNVTTSGPSLVHKLNSTTSVHEHSSVVPKKGVSDPPLSNVSNNNTQSSTTSSGPIKSSTTTTTSTEKPTPKSTTALPQKPKITEGAADQDASIINPNSKVLPSSAQKPKIVKFTKLHSDKKGNSADYVIPIIGVILSVPLVAIVISVLYKRGHDWWTHRNYRRMDFLIEGMYNT